MKRLTSDLMFEVYKMFPILNLVIGSFTKETIADFT